MGYLVVVNGEVLKASIFPSREYAEKERDWWEKYLCQTGQKLHSFTVVDTKANNRDC